VEIAFRNDAEGADGGEHSALGAVDLVNAVAFPHRSTVTGAWQVEILPEHLARVAIDRTIAFTRAIS
jgi:hypothetical protein